MNILESGGGHNLAAGFTLKKILMNLKIFFIKYLKKILKL